MLESLSKLQGLIQTLEDVIEKLQAEKVELEDREKEQKRKLDIAYAYTKQREEHFEEQLKSQENEVKLGCYLAGPETEPYVLVALLFQAESEKLKDEALAKRPIPALVPLTTDRGTSPLEPCPEVIQPPKVETRPAEGQPSTSKASLSFDLLPPKRRAVISSLPEVDLPLPDEGLGTGFGKKLVISQIGGNLQSSTNENHFAFRLHTNPWLPTQRLAHGFAYVGLPGRNNDDNIGTNGPVRRHLFVEDSRLGTSWKYMGVYEFGLISHPSLPDRNLTTDEWNALPQKVQEDYAQMAHTRYDGVVNREQLVQEYSNGTKNCPVRLVKCVGFDYDLYYKLVNLSNGASQTSESSSGTKRKAAVVQRSPQPKRRATGLKISVDDLRASEGADPEDPIADSDFEPLTPLSDEL